MSLRDLEKQALAAARAVVRSPGDETALNELRAAIEAVDAPPDQRRRRHRGGWGPPKPCRFCGVPRPTCKDGSLRYAVCSKGPGPGFPLCEAAP